MLWVPLNLGMSATHCQGNVREFQSVQRVVTLYDSCTWFFCQVLLSENSAFCIMEHSFTRTQSFVCWYNLPHNVGVLWHCAISINCALVHAGMCYWAFCGVVGVRRPAAHPIPRNQRKKCNQRWASVCNDGCGDKEPDGTDDGRQRQTKR